MDESSEQIAAADGPDVARRARSALWTDRRGQAKAPVGPPPLVVVNVHAEHTFEMSAAEDEDPVQALREGCIYWVTACDQRVLPSFKACGAPKLGSADAGM